MIAVVYFSIVLLGCSWTPGRQVVPYVDLSRKGPLPPVRRKEIAPLRVAIAAVISPRGSAVSYAPLMEYLDHALGRPVEAVQRGTYAEVNDLIRDGEVDLAFVCTSAFVRGRQEFGMQLLVAPQVDGETLYHASIIVPAQSAIQSIEGLRGRVFAFTDPMSLTGRSYPVYLLQNQGEDTESFFSRTFFTYSHDDAIYAVGKGLADGASVDSLVLRFALRRDPGLAGTIRVIHVSPPFGIPPVVVGPGVRPQLRSQLEELLLNMHLDPSGQAALAALDVDRFVLISEGAYQSAVAVDTAVQSAPHSSEP